MSIFISYAKEDVAKAHELYVAAEAAGLEPWMDKPPAAFMTRGLIPGENWRTRLDKEIRRAARAVLLLSRTSIAKRGYVQREFRLVLEIMNEMPGEARFALPLLIEDCDVPELVVGSIRLNDLQWVKLSEVDMNAFIDAISRDLAS